MGLQDPRREPRLSACCEVRVARGLDAWAGVTEDVGAGGCLVVVPRTVARGELLALTITPGAAQRALHVRGQVVWARSPRFGIRFVAARPGGETPAAWFDRFAVSHPDLRARVRQVPRDLELDARLFLGTPPPGQGPLSPNLREIARRVRDGAPVSDVLPLTCERDLFALLSRRVLALVPPAPADLARWERLLAGLTPTPADPRPSPVSPERPAETRIAPVRPAVPDLLSPPPLPTARPRRTPEAQQLYQAGVSLLVTGDALAAEALFRRALEYSPQDATLRGVLRQFELG